MLKIRTETHQNECGHKLNPTIADALDHIGAESQVWVLDALSCLFHNEGHGLTHNNEDKDQEWLARAIAFKLHPLGHPNHLESISPEARAQYMTMAQVCLDCLPGLMSRISARYLRYESALRSMEQLARAKQIAQRNMYVENLPKRDKE